MSELMEGLPMTACADRFWLQNATYLQCMLRADWMFSLELILNEQKMAVIKPASSLALTKMLYATVSSFIFS